MKKKEGKGLASLSSSEAGNRIKAICFQETNAAFNDNAWLKSVLGEDPESTARQTRRLCAEHFLQTELYRLVDLRQEINEDLLADVFLEYRKARPDPESSFELSNVLGSLLNRFDCYTIENMDAHLHRSKVLDRDLEIFIALSEIDLMAVERVVEERIRNT